jgi:hypothetical protein
LEGKEVFRGSTSEAEQEKEEAGGILVREDLLLIAYALGVDLWPPMSQAYLVFREDVLNAGLL